MKRNYRCLLLLALFALPAAAQSPNVTELATGWRLASAQNVSGDEAQVSQPGFDASGWYAIQHMPATVLQVL